MKVIQILITLCLLFNISKAQNIALEGSQTAFFDSIQPAIDAAQNGDYIYVPAGIYNYGIIINKGVHLIGTGQMNDSTVSTGPTVFTATISISNGASGGSIEGIQSTQDFYAGIFFQSSSDVDDFTIERCKLISLQVGTSFASPFCNNLKIRQCDIEDIFLTQAWNVSVQNCIIRDIIDNVEGGGLIENCVFTDGSGSGVTDGESLVIRNNIFLASLFLGGISTANFNSVIYNNIIYNAFGTIDNSNALSNNIDDYEDTGIPGFVDFSNGNYNINPTSIILESGTNGSDPGIYDGPYPWKDGSLPAIPHIYFHDIPSITNGDGNLPVVIKANAQN